MATWYSQGSGLWSTLANWNDAANGSGSAPASIAAFDDSPVVIQAGHVVEFDVEDAVAVDGSVSGWTTGIAGITVTSAAEGNTPGELTLTDTANNANRVYGLRIKAGTKVVGTNAAVLGKVTGGTESVPIPTTAVHIIQFLDPTTSGGFDLRYLSLALYCAAPVETIYVTTAAAGIGDSVLSVEGRVTACNPNTDTTEWQVGREVVVVRNTSAGVNTQTTTISSVGDGTITLADNLTVEKPAGSYVVLTQRNIEIRDATTSTTGAGTMLVYGGTGAVLDCSMRRLPATKTDIYGISAGTSHTVQGSAVISGCLRGISAGTSCTVQGSAVISGCPIGIYSGTSHTVQGSATISGCTYGIYRSANTYVADTVTISSNTAHYRMDTADDSVFSYATPTSGTDVYSLYKLNVAPAVATPRVEIWPSGYEAAGTGEVTRRYPSTYIYGSYPRIWCNGGRSQSQTSVLPTGHTVGGQLIFEQHADIVTAGNKALYCWNWVAVPVTVGGSQRARITVNVRKDTSFSGYIETPMVQIVDALYDGTNIDTDSLMSSSMADTQDTWQTKTFTVSDPGLFFVRILGRHDTGNLYYTVTIGYEYARGGGGQTNPMRGWRITDGPYDDIYRGIEGLWLMNDGTGTIVADASGKGRHGTIIGAAVWTPNAAGGGLNPNAAGYVDIPASGIRFGTGDFTIVYRAAAGTMAGLERMVSGGYTAAGEWFMRRLISPDGTWGFYGNTGSISANSSTFIAAAPTSYVAVRRGATMTLYQDAVAVGSDGSAGADLTYSADIHIGAAHNDTLRWNGTIDYAAIWSRALSAQEVRRLHEQPPWMVG